MDHVRLDCSARMLGKFAFRIKLALFNEASV